ncbi:hypothetical protein JOB18_012008 [Solea senegalensis]|uniref:Uncharacterized protein n=1 Tax=Solea senegalensis TaxID=28829 RepID=A0AAV6QNC9_SOLSE|nr:hypothetical protein JOB18_012008 [Solea senegalensis]
MDPDVSDDSVYDPLRAGRRGDVALQEGLTNVRRVVVVVSLVEAVIGSKQQ